MAKKKHQKTSGDKKNKLKNKMKFKYVIPDGLRDYYVNGVHGSVHPQGLINMHLFSERIPIPKSIISKPDERGIYEESEREFGADVIRLVQASILMEKGFAIVLRDWLNTKIDDVDKTIERTNEIIKEAQEELKDE